MLVNSPVDSRLSSTVPFTLVSPHAARNSHVFIISLGDRSILLIFLIKSVTNDLICVKMKMTKNKTNKLSIMNCNTEMQYF